MAGPLDLGFAPLEVDAHPGSPPPFLSPFRGFRSTNFPQRPIFSPVQRRQVPRHHSPQALQASTEVPVRNVKNESRTHPPPPSHHACSSTVGSPKYVAEPPERCPHSKTNAQLQAMVQVCGPLRVNLHDLCSSCPHTPSLSPPTRSTIFVPRYTCSRSYVVPPSRNPFRT